MARDEREKELSRPIKVFAEESVVVGKRKPHRGRRREEKERQR